MGKKNITVKLGFGFITLLTTSLILDFVRLPGYSQECSKGVTNTANYSFRGDRCEGIQKGQVDQTSSGPFRLVSLATGSINTYEKQITLRILASIPNEPETKIQSLRRDYLMNKPNFNTKSPPYIYQWPTNILRQQSIPPDSLRAIAWTSDARKNLYLPVVLGVKPSQYYEIVWYTRYKAKITRFEIKPANTNNVVKNCPLMTFEPNQEVFCQWDGRNQPKGRYKIYVEAELYPSGKPTKYIKPEITFEHNPEWLSK